MAAHVMVLSTGLFNDCYDDITHRRPRDVLDGDLRTQGVKPQRTVESIWYLEAFHFSNKRCQSEE